VITVTNLVKRYGDVTALQDLSLTVPTGTVFGVLGPNGAGKTTLLRLIVGLIFPDGGSIELEGCPRHRLGYLPERPHFPGRFRVNEYMLVAGQLSGLVGTELRERVSAALAQTGLSQVADRRISSCSKGMLQRLGLAQCLLTDPPLILLDEPLSGLDPAAQAAMRHLVRALSHSGKTIVLSTHRLADVSQMCSHIAILARGRLSQSGPLPQVLAPRVHLLIQVDQLPDSVSGQISHLHPAIALNGTDIVLAEEAIGAKRQVLQILLDAQVDIVRLESQGSTLEEVYLEAVRTAGEP
jgi:ABC-2 type transport system ATP-binding protein